MSILYTAPFTTRPEIQGTFGVAATTHWIATAVAMGILEKGGNAFDAGVAAAFTLQVVEPHLCGPLGDVPIMIAKRDWDKPQVICGQGPSPAGATIAHMRGHLGLDMMPGTGLLPAVVPGTFETYMLVLERYGTMRLRDVLAPAREAVIDAGIPAVSPDDDLRRVAALFLEHGAASLRCVDAAGNVVGIVTRDAVAARLAEGGTS